MTANEQADRNVHDGTSVRRSRVDPEDYVPPLLELAWVRVSQRGISSVDHSMVLDGYVRFEGRKIFRFYWQNLSFGWRDGELAERLQLFDMDIPHEWYVDGFLDDMFYEDHPALGFEPLSVRQCDLATECALFRNDLAQWWEETFLSGGVWQVHDFEDYVLSLGGEL